MGSRRHRDVAQIPAPSLLSRPDNRHSRPLRRPEDWGHPDRADSRVQAEGADVDRKSESHTIFFSTPFLTVASIALWWFRRSFRERNFVHRPDYANGFGHIGQPVVVPVCHMLGADTIHPFTRRANDVRTVRGDPDTDEHVADSSRQAGKFPGRAFQAKRPPRSGCVYGCVEYDVGSEATTGGHGIGWPVPSAPYFGPSSYPFLEALRIEIDLYGFFRFWWNCFYQQTNLLPVIHKRRRLCSWTSAPMYTHHRFTISAP